MMNAMTFRGLRETVGYDRRDAAEEIGVTEDAVNRWEQGVCPIPGKAEAWARKKAERFDKRLKLTIRQHEQQMASFVKENGLSPEDCEGINLMYYESQEQCDSWSREPENYGLHNAITRALAIYLRGRGFEVAFRSPIELAGWNFNYVPFDEDDESNG